MDDAVAAYADSAARQVRLLGAHTPVRGVCSHRSVRLFQRSDHRKPVTETSLIDDEAIPARGESIAFLANGVYGDPANPTELHVALEAVVVTGVVSGTDAGGRQGRRLSGPGWI